MRIPLCVVRGIVALVTVSAFPGCSLLFFGRDYLTPKGDGTRLVDSRATGVFALEPNTKAHIMMSDGTEHYGMYLGLSTPHPDTLLARARGRSTPGCGERSTLLTGDTVRVQRSDGTSVTAVFLGAYPTGIRLRASGDPSLTAIPFASIAGISWCDGARMQRRPFEDTFLSGAFEFAQYVQLRTADGAIQLPLWYVERVQYRREESSNVLSYILLSIGLAALAVLLTLWLLHLLLTKVFIHI